MRSAEQIALAKGRLRNPAEDNSASAARGEPRDPADSPSERLEREERCRQVRQAIAGLAEEQRAVLVLRKWTAAVMRPSRRSWTCPSARCGVACTGRECSCASS